MKKFIPHLTFAFAIMTLTFFVIDRFNEIMSFMTSELSKWTFALLAVCSIITSVYLIIDNWRSDERKAAKEARRRREENRRVEDGEGPGQDD